MTGSARAPGWLPILSLPSNLKPFRFHDRDGAALDANLLGVGAAAVAQLYGMQTRRHRELESAVIQSMGFAIVFTINIQIAVKRGHNDLQDRRRRAIAVWMVIHFPTRNDDRAVGIVNVTWVPVPIHWTVMILADPYVDVHAAMPASMPVPMPMPMPVPMPVPVSAIVSVMPVMAPMVAVPAMAPYVMAPVV